MGTTMQDDIESIANKYSEAIEIVGVSVIERLVAVWLHIDCIFKLSKLARIQKKALENLHVFTLRIIKERRNHLKLNNINLFDDTCDKGNKGKLAMLDLLFEHQKLGNIDNEGIREEVDTFMFEVCIIYPMVNGYILRPLNIYHILQPY